MEKIKINLVEWIKSNGLTVEYFACLLRVDKSYIYKISRGEHVPSAKTMKKINKITAGKMLDTETFFNE